MLKFKETLLPVTKACQACGGILQPRVDAVVREIPSTLIAAGQKQVGTHVTCIECGSWHHYSWLLDQECQVMAETTKQSQAQGGPKKTRKELLEQLRRLDEDIIDTEKQKRDNAAAYNDQLADKKQAKKDILEDLKKTPE